jgi:oligoribonuclease
MQSPNNLIFSPENSDVSKPCAGLIWLDLEMTGLDPARDTILEIATVITDNNLNIITQGPSFAIHQSDEILNLMDAWNVEQHTSSGLIEKVRKSTITLAEAEQQTLHFLKEWCAAQSSPLCGNTIYQDRAFLRAHMPQLNDFFHYRLIDVSTVKELVQRWYPPHPQAFYIKKDVHRALDDVYAAIDELKHYRTHFFQAN